VAATGLIAPAVAARFSSKESSIGPMATKNTDSVLVECIIPILSVENLPASLHYYVEVLGFSIDWGGEDGSGMASVSRDGKAIMLCEGEQGKPGTWVWIGVEDIEPLFDTYRAQGARFRQLPTNYPWAYEMRIEDLDGNVLRFGAEPKANLPVTGTSGQSNIG
jgi:catechol 2,3-dioxygenase-like lactoylglutathione lyase family enzyme